MNVSQDDKDRGGRRIKLVFIINGQDVDVNADANEPLREAVERALKKSGNTGRPTEEWEVRDASGTLLDQSRTPAGLRLRDGTRLFLSLRVGAGGFGKRRS